MEKCGFMDGQNNFERKIFVWLGFFFKFLYLDPVFDPFLVLCLFPYLFWNGEMESDYLYENRMYIWIWFFFFSSFLESLCFSNFLGKSMEKVKNLEVLISVLKLNS